MSLDLNEDGRSKYLVKVTELNEMFKRYEKKMREELENIRSELVLSLIRKDIKEKQNSESSQ